MTGKDVWLEKDLLEKAVTIKRLKYSLLGKELEKQTSIAEKQIKKVDNTLDVDKITANSVFMNIVTLILIVFLLNQNLNF